MAPAGTEADEVTFARDLGLFDATMIGVGAMIGAGIFVLTGMAAGEAGPASILAFALNGVVTLFTAFAYAELASAIPRAGGGYSFVRMAFPGARRLRLGLDAVVRLHRRLQPLRAGLSPATSGSSSTSTSPASTAGRVRGRRRAPARCCGDRC